MAKSQKRLYLLQERTAQNSIGGITPLFLWNSWSLVNKMQHQEETAVLWSEVTRGGRQFH